MKLVEYLTDEANYTTMVNPVTRVESLGLWMDPADEFPVSCNSACAVLLQEQDSGEVVAVSVIN